MRLASFARALAASTLIALFSTQPAFAWGAAGHRMINRLAAANLPPAVPAFLRNGNALDTLEYLGPEPDRWRNKAELELNLATTPDHFIDLEWADLAGPFPRSRFDFIRQLAVAQPAHPQVVMTPEKIGLQPWATAEVWDRLKVDMREYRRLLAAGADTAPVQTAILYDAGWLGHYVGDGSQPLHTTIQYNGWTGPNPNGYSPSHAIHSKFETVYVSANSKPAEINALVAAAPVQPIADEWAQYLAYLRHSNSEVEHLYQLDKTGAFDGPGTPEGRAFVNERIAAGAIELRDLIAAAWTHSADPIEEYKGPA